jgi:D-3-phosphoglycerate dehydrogenase
MGFSISTMRKSPKRRETRMKVAILGDLFVTNEVLQAAFEAAFEKAERTFEFVYLTDTWPVTPVMKTEEISEFVGDEEEVCGVVGEAEVILTHTAPITRRVVETAGRLRIIGAARGWPVNINWNACSSRGVPVLYAPGRNSTAVAEFTVGLMLAQSRNITRSHVSLMVERRWRGDLYTYDVVGKELGSSTVGLIGAGAIGSKVARILHAFGSRILVYDPRLDGEQVKAMGAEPVDLETLLKTADFISLHARLTKETEGMIGKREISFMKRNAYLINTARSELINHDDLYAALREKRIAGAALDVFEAEPPPEDSPVYRLDNITATSHLAGSSIQAAEIGARVLCEGVRDFLIDGIPPKFCVNPNYADHLAGKDTAWKQ